MATANPKKNSKDHQRYRRFVYSIATTMVHEFGHMFITFLAQGRSNTPRSMPSEPGALHGEAGDELEQILFGGVHVFTRNTDEDEAQVCSNMCSSTEEVAHDLTNALVRRPVPAYQGAWPPCDHARDRR